MSGQPRGRYCQHQGCENQMFPTEKSPRKPQMRLMTWGKGKSLTNHHAQRPLAPDQKNIIKTWHLLNLTSVFFPKPILKNSRISSSEKKLPTPKLVS